MCIVDELNLYHISFEEYLLGSEMFLIFIINTNLQEHLKGLFSLGEMQRKRSLCSGVFMASTDKGGRGKKI